MALIAYWSGKWPNLCSGKWSLTCNDIELEIPEDKIHNPMGTHGFYRKLNSTTSEEISYFDYEDGMYFDEWARWNGSWVKQMFEKVGIKMNGDLYANVFLEFQKHDWRRNSCGGCR